MKYCCSLIFAVCLIHIVAFSECSELKGPGPRKLHPFAHKVKHSKRTKAPILCTTRKPVENKSVQKAQGSIDRIRPLATERNAVLMKMRETETSGFAVTPIMPTVELLCDKSNSSIERIEHQFALLSKVSVLAIVGILSQIDMSPAIVFPLQRFTRELPTFAESATDLFRPLLKSSIIQHSDQKITLGRPKQTYVTKHQASQRISKKHIIRQPQATAYQKTLRTQVSRSKDQKN